MNSGSKENMAFSRPDKHTFIRDLATKFSAIMNRM